MNSPETYNFGLDRSLNLDYKLTNNIAAKYAWSGQSKLNEYRGYAWTALRDLDPGVLTQATQSFNTTFNPTILKWLKPALNYSANYRWSDDLTREGQNISTQLRFGSNFSITPSQIIELVYKPKVVRIIEIQTAPEILGIEQEVEQIILELKLRKLKKKK